MALIPHH